MREDVDEGLSVCVSVCLSVWGGENAATVC